MKPPYWNTILGSGFGAGLIPVAPGTFGTISGLIPLLLLHLLFGYWGTLLFIVGSVFLNYYCYPTFSQNYGADPGSFVLDEWAGMGLSVLPMYLLHFDTIITIGLAFALFRFFDVSKILGINELQNMPEAHGVLFDDLLAGLYSAICLFLLIFVIR